MEHFDVNALISSHIQLSQDIFLLQIHAPYIAFAAKPGQFCMIKVSGDANDPLLRRPLSIHRVHDGGFVSFLYKVIGKGTKCLSEYKAGEKLNVLGPLGNHFAIRPAEKVIIIGGGIGVAPLVFLAERIAFKHGTTVLLGFRNREDVCCVEDFEKLAARTLIATEDGSLGHKGLITDLLREEIMHNPDLPKYFYTCGPFGMQKAINNLIIEELGEKKAHLEVSLEARMACGIGVCMSCVTQARDGDYLHVCKDGPVFNAKKILWK